VPPLRREGVREFDVRKNAVGGDSRRRWQWCEAANRRQESPPTARIPGQPLVEAVAHVSTDGGATVSLFTIAANKTLSGLATVIVVNALVSGSLVFAQNRVNWATGAAFQRQLAEPGTILWADNPLRPAIEGLSRARKVAVLIDRRVDPGQKLNISLKDMPLESALQAIARSRGLDVACLGSVVYLGPPSAAERLGVIAASLEQSLRRLPLATQRTYYRAKRLGWEDLATPRELLTDLAREGGLEIVGLEHVPHDLWAAADLPAMPLTGRLALIVVQFDLALKVTDRGRRIELVPLSETIRRSDVAGSRSTPKPATTAKAEPPATLEQTRIDRISVTNKPLGPVLKQLANRLGFELRIDEKAIAVVGISLDQLVSVHLENATVDELLRQLLKPTRLTFHRRGRIVEIVPAE
jgi:hypothetical protein